MGMIMHTVRNYVIAIKHGKMLMSHFNTLAIHWLAVWKN